MISKRNFPGLLSWRPSVREVRGGLTAGFLLALARLVQTIASYWRVTRVLFRDHLARRAVVIAAMLEQRAMERSPVDLVDFGHSLTHERRSSSGTTMRRTASAMSRSGRRAYPKIRPRAEPAEA